MQERVYKTAVYDLKQCLIDTWTCVSQNIIDKAVDQWRKWLHECEKANI